MDNLQPYKISLDFYIRKIITVNAKQLDSDSRVINITCTENGKKFFVDASTTSAFVRYRKSDGHAVLNQINILSDGTVNLELSQQMLAVEGRHLADIMLINKSELTLFTDNISVTDDGDGNVVVLDYETKDIINMNVEEILTAISENGINVLSTMSFYINTESVVIDGLEIESSDEYKALADGFNKMVAVDNRMSTLEQTINKNETQRQEAEKFRKQVFEEAKSTLDKIDIAIENAKNEGIYLLVDSELSESSTNPVQNNAIHNALEYKANAIINTVSGTTILTTDSAKEKPSITTFGKSTQKTYLGTNLLDKSLYTLKEGNINGLEYLLEEGGIKISGTIENNTVTAGQRSNNAKMENLQKLPKGVYSVPRFNIGGYDMELVCHCYDENYNPVANISNKNVTVNSEFYVLSISVYVHPSIPSNIDVFIPFQLNAAPELLEYEPYVGCQPSPNVHYPQEVTSLGESGSIDGKVLNKNRFNLEKALDATNWNKRNNGYSYYVMDGLEANTTYTFSFAKNTFVAGNNIYVSLSDSSDEIDWENGSIVHPGASYIKTQRTLISSSDGCLYLHMYNVNDSNLQTLFENCLEPQLEPGTSRTAYEPYTEQLFTALTPNGLGGIPLGATIPDAIKNSPIHLAGVYWDEKEGQYLIANTVDGNGEGVLRIFKERLLADKTTLISDSSNEESNLFVIRVSSYLPSSNNEFLCDIVLPQSSLTTPTYIGNGGLLNPGWNTAFYVRVRKDTGITTLDEFKQYLTDNEVYVTLVREEPIVTKTDVQCEVVMNYPNTTIVNDAGAYQRVTYISDTKKYIANIEKKHEEDIQTLKNAILSLGGNV